MTRAGILGASGLVGGHLSTALRARGDEVVAASLRDPVKAAAQVAGCDVVVNLAGENVAQRWTSAAKQRIRASRVEAPRAFLDALARQERKVTAYICASAVGYYPPSETATYTESSSPGTDFLGQVCVEWEREANRAIDLGLRVAVLRTGVVLAANGGALAKMLPAFRMGLGGVIGSGRQWISWIHIDDLAGIYLHAIDGHRGVFNATAPQPVTNAELTRALGAALHRPTIFPVPVFALGLLLGEGATILTEGQRVLPERTLAEGYRFRHTCLDDALTDLL